MAHVNALGTYDLLFEVHHLQSLYIIMLVYCHVIACFILRLMPCPCYPYSFIVYMRGRPFEVVEP